MIACFKKSLCRKSILALMLSIALGAMTLAGAQRRSAASDLNTKVAQIDIDKANLDDVVRVFGEPKRYYWGNEETGEIKMINKEDLSSRQFYIADYGDGFRIFMLGGRIAELRFEGESEYLHQGQLQVGDSLDHVLKVLGEPKETVVGESRKMISPSPSPIPDTTSRSLMHWAFLARNASWLATGSIRISSPRA